MGIEDRLDDESTKAAPIGHRIIVIVTRIHPPASRPSLVLLPGLDGTGKLFSELVRAELPTDRPFVLLGESFSGPIAIRIGADPPANLAGIILCGTFAKNPYPLFGWVQPLAAWFPVKSLPRWLRAPLMWGSMEPQRAPGQLTRAMSAVSEVVVRHRIAALLAVDASAALARIRLPMLVLQARRDLVIPRSATQWILNTAPHARLIEIDGPHLLLQTRPVECAAAVSKFVRTVI